MGRKRKDTVDYFSHDCKHGDSLRIVEVHYQASGYACWFKLLELLGRTPGHQLSIKDSSKKLTLIFSECGLSKSKGLELLELFGELEMIDQESFKDGKIWSQSFMDRLSHVYSKRKIDVPEKDITVTETPITDPETPITVTEVHEVKESKVKESKKEKKKKEILVDETFYIPVIEDFNNVFVKSYKYSKDIIQLINARYTEGYTFGDFQKVHRNMKTAWENNSEMAQYLRPQTLYTAKFSSYLNRVVDNGSPRETF